MGISGGCYLIQGDQGGKVSRTSFRPAKQRCHRSAAQQSASYFCAPKVQLASQILQSPEHAVDGVRWLRHLSTSCVRFASWNACFEVFRSGELSYFGQLLHPFQGWLVFRL